MNYFAFTANHAKQERDDLLKRMHATNEALAGPSTKVFTTIQGPSGERIPCGSESRPLSVPDVFDDAGTLEISCYLTGNILRTFAPGTWVECHAYDAHGDLLCRFRPGQPSETRGVL